MNDVALGYDVEDLTEDTVIDFQEANASIWATLSAAADNAQSTELAP